MAVYCAANLRARRTPQVPAVLRPEQLPAIQIPRELDPEVARTDEAPAGNGLVPAGDLAELSTGARR
jgi:hypothetical protein